MDELENHYVKELANHLFLTACSAQVKRVSNGKSSDPFLVTKRFDTMKDTSQNNYLSMAKFVLENFNPK